MYAYVKGFIKEIESDYIVVDNNGVGYLVYTASHYSFELDKEYTVYLYQHVREDEITLYGFKSLDEKKLFLRLTSVKGLGCKMALPMLALGSPEGIIDAIERENVLYLELLGACAHCPSAYLTTEGFIEQELRKAIPALKRVVLDQTVDESLLEQARQILRKSQTNDERK